MKIGIEQKIKYRTLFLAFFVTVLVGMSLFFFINSLLEKNLNENLTVKEKMTSDLFDEIIEESRNVYAKRLHWILNMEGGDSGLCQQKPRRFAAKDPFMFQTASV
jgi:hypothetical protein